MRGLTRYLRVLAVFGRNSLVRATTFRANFLIECVTSLAWVLMNLGFYVLIFRYTPSIGSEENGWTIYPYFVLLATMQFVSSLVETFFMPNTEEFSELVRTGDLDFALLKPIDTQFLVSLAKFEFSSLSNFVFAGCLLTYALVKMDYRPGLGEVLLYPLYLGCGVAIFYSLMIALAAVTVWLGRNQSIYDFWFYITNFSRFPLEIYTGPLGFPLQLFFSFVIPILLVVNVPARLLAKPMHSAEWPLARFALAATVCSLLASRWLFRRALESYRSASS